MEENKKKLTPRMQEILSKMEFGKRYSAYELKCSLSTLFALYERGLVNYKVGLGGSWFPRSEIMWIKKYI